MGCVRILLVDDEQALLKSVARSLRFEGHHVVPASDGHEALQLLPITRPDVVVLDVMMPGISGLEVCRRIRSSGDRTPILMLTAKADVGDRVSGLDAGADDYLVKPFAYEELLARLRSLHRRTLNVSEGEPVTFGPLRLDPTIRQVSVDGEPLELSRTEYALLETLMRSPQQVLTRAQLFDAVWGRELDESSNSLHVYIGYLRRKLESRTGLRLIHTVRGVGYTLRMPECLSDSD